MEVKGYKAFSKNKVNRYGKVFEEDTHYHIDGEISFGNYGNGLHFCKRMEDTFRYVDAMNSKVEIAEVVGSGEMVEFNDEYYGYYDMYSASDLYVVRFLSRKEIIEHFLKQHELAVKRFVGCFKLTDEEIMLFKIQFADNINIMNAIAYYQEKDLDVYSRKSDSKKFVKKKVGDTNE